MMYCMGLEINRAQCMKCKRLPRSVADEDEEKWIDHESMGTPCMSHLQQKELA